MTHNRDEAYRLCNRITVLSDGKISVSDEKWSLFSHPKTYAGALLTGCKNISPAKKSGDYQIFAEDWGITLMTSTYVKEEVAFVGIRARQMERRTVASKVNIFSCQVHSIMEDTFGNIFMLLPAATVGKRALRWEAPRTEVSASDRQWLEIYIPPEIVLPLYT